ncbi:branched-chain amino acid ABC transporter permease [Vagococcus lutrae]|uniref:branched-chain amino acid ABC transporter permease n=1 Tax=Vagococcus lutrae TaxID=81947 RepID=UPI0028901E54|nr:branched-chain amino acid ABC transporter permease [Vagococcus lutrae]MDT2817783.1 branched-chain amino acid ABC transporter permease [Vagococcus lutrae]
MKSTKRLSIIWFVLIVLGYGIIFALRQSMLMSDMVIDSLSMIGINIILAVSLNLIIGFSGQFSLGHAGFMAVGAYTTAIFTMHYPTYLGFLLSIVLGAMITALLALLVGLPTLRLKGDYLAIATLGIAEIIRIVIVNGQDDPSEHLFATGGAAGIFGVVNYANWEVIYILMVLSILIISHFIHSDLGRMMLAVREDEIAAESIGIQPTSIKVLAFVIGATIASVAGSLHASYVQTIVPNDFGFMKSIDILIIVVFGGIGSLTGSIVAGVLLGILNHFLRNVSGVSDYRMIIYSLALILMMLYKPSGLMGEKEFSLKHLLKRNMNKKEASL